MAGKNIRNSSGESFFIVIIRLDRMIQSFLRLESRIWVARSSRAMTKKRKG
jgi:hypothetical protein